MCPGKEYARVTILVFLHNVVTMFKWEPILVAEKSKFDMVLVPSSPLSSVDLDSSSMSFFSVKTAQINITKFMPLLV